jgi:predicted phosphohydrolase
MQLSAALPDLAFIGRLPGKKILLRGNHDYWWSAIGACARRCRGHARAAKRFVCGRRRWYLRQPRLALPGSSGLAADDEKIYQRELDRLSLSLRSLPEVETKVAMLHYPPFADRDRASGFTERLEQAGVSIAVYGHLHGEANRYAFEGEKNGVVYHCVAADKLNFTPKLIFEK